MIITSGGFDGTSNVLAGKLFNIPVKGTHAHAYVTSFTGAADLENTSIAHKDDPEKVETDFFGKCVEWRTKLAVHLRILSEEAHDGELAAFASYAIAFPDGFLALVDTYDVSRYIWVVEKQGKVLKKKVEFVNNVFVMFLKMAFLFGDDIKSCTFGTEFLLCRVHFLAHTI